MSLRARGTGWEVRWRDVDGRHRARRFASEEAARAFDEAISETSPTSRSTGAGGSGSGVYSYRTAAGLRWRFVVRRSDGTQTTKRGFTSERAARDARRRLVEQVERGRGASHEGDVRGPLGALARAAAAVSGAEHVAGIRRRRADAAAAGVRGDAAGTDRRRGRPAPDGRARRAGRGGAAVSQDGEQHPGDAGRLPERSGRGRPDRGEPGAAGRAAAAGAHRARVPAAARDPGLPRRLRPGLPPARRGADRDRDADLRGVGAPCRRCRAGGDGRVRHGLPVTQAREDRLDQVRPLPVGRDRAWPGARPAPTSSHGGRSSTTATSRARTCS